MQREKSHSRRLVTPEHRASGANDGPRRSRSRTRRDGDFEGRRSRVRDGSRHLGDDGDFAGRRSRVRDSSRHLGDDGDFACRRSRVRDSSRHIGDDGDYAGQRSRVRDRSRRRGDDGDIVGRRSRVRDRSRHRGDDRLYEMEMDHRRLRDRELSRMRGTVNYQRDLGKCKPSSKNASRHRESTSCRRERSSHATNINLTEENRTRIVRLDQPLNRSSSPTFSARDVANILNSIKNLPSQQSTSAPTQSSNSYKNILSDFDPSTKTQRIDIWINKVNECATVYGWDDKTTVHFAMQKLQGLAKVWYESLPTILFSWTEWQNKLLNAFPPEQNYGQALEDMLKRKSRFNEPIEVYFYEKQALLNQCNIQGRNAVDCIIHGLTDRTMKSSALTLRCTQPEQLLQFLMSNKESTLTFDKQNYKFRPKGNHDGIANNAANKQTGKPYSSSSSEILCYNCHQKGHPFLKCPQPIVKCGKCNRLGHKTENCFANVNTDSNKNVVRKTMCITNADPNSKFFKVVEINTVHIKCYIDFGSEVSLIKQSQASELGLQTDKCSTVLKGFGNELVHTLGTVPVHLTIDGVSANVTCHVVEDKYLELPLLIGQTFTEQSHVIVYKTADSLNFINICEEMPFADSKTQSEASIEVVSVAFVDIYGLTCVNAKVNLPDSCEILIESKVIGKPFQQLIVLGALYPVKRGFVKLFVTPAVSRAIITDGMILSRGLKVKVVNQVNASFQNPVNDRKFNENDVRIGESIKDCHRQQLLAVLNKFNHCFATSLKELGCTNTTEMTIELNKSSPIVYRPYRLSFKERENVREMVNDMLDAGIVRESVSEYASPIILVRKKDGKMRMCVDYRMLNAITVKERYPMPNIEDEISRLCGQAYFITLDLTSGYYQVPISEQSRAFTSFVTPDGQYEFNRMPFGLANAPAVFQRMMHRVLGSVRYDGATSYIDDVLIYGKDVIECLTRLEKVLKLLEDANLTLNMSKCEFLMNKIDYLGYEISFAGIRPGNKKIQCVVDFPCPTDQHTVRQFLGLVGYFRKFIKNFATHAYPLTKLLSKNAVWSWSEEQDRAFRALKDKLVNRPVLAIYNPAADTELHTDASKLGIGGVLLQRSHDNIFKPVAYYSRKTSPEEMNFHAYELETLAVVCSLKKFRVYLLGQQFKVVTDCSALRSTFSKRDILPRIARWWLLMQEYQCTIEYRPGTKMAHVDALSRNAIADDGTSTVFDGYPSVMSITSEDWLHTLQLGDEELNRIRNVLISELDVDGLKYIKDNFLIKDNRLYRYLDGDRNNIRWVVPKGARWQLCRLNHDEIGHFGVEKTLERIKKAYWFPKMSKFVKKYVSACIECAYSKNNSSTSEGHLHPIEKQGIPFHTLHVDHLGPFVRSKRGNSYLFVIVDSFTKFVFAKAVRNTKSQSAIRVLEDIFYTFRVPDRLISDRGSCFTSHTFKRFCLDKGVKHVLNAVASPRSNGQVERYNRTILQSLTAQNLNRDERDWDESVGKVQWGLNNTLQKTTGKTPSELMFGIKISSEINPMLNDIIRETREESNLISAREQAKVAIDTDQEKQKQRYDKNRKPAKTYSEGELVKITKTAFSNDGKSKKLLPVFIGPYRVVSVLGNDRYRVAAIPGLTGTKNKRQTAVAADRMLPWVNVAALEVNESDAGDSQISDIDE